MKIAAIVSTLVISHPAMMYGSLGVPLPPTTPFAAVNCELLSMSMGARRMWVDAEISGARRVAATNAVPSRTTTMARVRPAKRGGRTVFFPHDSQSAHRRLKPPVKRSPSLTNVTAKRPRLRPSDNVGPRGSRQASCERHLLDRECEVLDRAASLAQDECRGEHPTERNVHALHAVRQWEERLPVPRELLEDRSSGEREAALPRELVEHVADADVERLPEDAIPTAGEGDDLCVASADVQEDRVLRVRDTAADLKMRDAVIHPEKRDVEGEGEGPRRGRDGAKAWAQPRALRERDQVEVLKIHPRNVGRFPDQRHDHLRVVIRGL